MTACKELRAGAQNAQLDGITAIPSKCAAHRVMRSQELQSGGQIGHVVGITGFDVKNYKQVAESATWSE